MTNEEEIKALNQKMDQVLNVLRDFGLSIIENIGGLKHSIGVITDQVEDINRNLIFIKGLGVKIDELGKIKEDVSNELKYIQTLIKAGSFPKQQINNEEQTQDSAKETPVDILNSLNGKLDGLNDLDSLVTELGSAKERIFTITGGHRILHEINSEIKILKKEQDLTQDLKSKIGEKIQFWMNKI